MRSLFPKTLISAIAVQPKSVVRFKGTTALRSMNSGFTHRMFQLKLDPLTGNSEWVVIEEEEDELQEDSPKPLLATTSYLDMLNDSRRNRAYREAIDKTVTKPCHVLDIGAGTGLLSLMAARAMGLRKSTSCSSSMGTVTACESYLPMLKLMRKVLRANDMEGEIRVINKRSDELIAGVDFTSRADILVSEILDSELLGEGLIPTLQQAHDKLLVDNPQTVPYRATTYGQLVESTYLRKLHDLYNNEAETLDGIQLVPKGMERLLCVKPQQFAMHCDAIRDEIKLLSEPFKIFEFDFWRRPESYEETQLQIKAIGDGTVHAVVSWWTLQLDKEATIFYSTSPKWTSSPLKIDELNSSLPGTANWCDHWKQCVWFIPGKGLSLHKDDEVNFCATHSDTSISYEIKSRVGDREVQEFRSSPRDNQIFLSPERVAIYGDNSWRCSMFNAVKNILLQKDSPLCIVADDSIFLAIAVAHLSKTAHVLSVFPGLRGKVSQYLQSVSFANGFSMDQVEVINRRRPQLTMDDTHHKKVDLLIAEPFYCGNDNGLPWQNLRFWKERTMLDTVLSEDVVIMPCKGILKACAMSMPDLWTSRRCLKEIEGFDHSVVNSTLGACGDSASSRETPCLPYFIWQCGDIKELSEIVTVLEFDFSKPISKCFGKAQVKFLNSGICHGFVLWIDWVMDEKNSIMLSTGPVERYWKQGVKLLAKPIPVECFSSIEIEASFDPSSAEQLLINHSFST